ncbi:unnamed protein product [Cuscuta campestris]|uniref:Uncharacterized protein n=1 Tax=Cuscuta campestris TaxID=132261 RepID=A0A484NCP4_9ASTE|nr:unnamed protein product [Cuscuta campestris]
MSLLSLWQRGQELGRAAVKRHRFLGKGRALFKSLHKKILIFGMFELCQMYLQDNRFVPLPWTMLKALLRLKFPPSQSKPELVVVVWDVARSLHLQILFHVGESVILSFMIPVFIYLALT